MREVLLGDLCKFRAGSAFPQDEQGSVQGDFPFVKVSDMSLPLNGKRITVTNNWITSEQRMRLRASVAAPGAVLFAKIGAGLLAERFRVATRETAFDNNMMSATANPVTCDATYLYYLLQTLGVSRHAVGSALPYLKQRDLERIICVVPDLGGQRAIAEVLEVLDDKIAANATLVVSLDALSRVRFESLLVDADVRPLSSLARFVNGRAFTKDASGTGRVVIRIAELTSGIGGSTVYSDIAVTEDHLSRPGDLLFAWSGSLTVQRWFRPEGIVNQHIFKVVPIDVPLWVVKGALDRKLLEFKTIAADKATTMGHIQRRHLDELVNVPSEAVSKQNDAVMTGLWQRALAAEQESLHLESLRNALLPLLMSGKVRVKDVERVVEEAV